MLKKHIIHQESALHRKIHHSLMYGALHHIYMMLILLYALFYSITGTAFDTSYYEYLKESVNVACFSIVFLELTLKFALSPKEFLKKPWHIAEVIL